MNGRVLRVLCVSRIVADLARAKAFYCAALGFRTVEEAAHTRPVWAQLPAVAATPIQTTRLRIGQQEMELTAFEPDGAPYPPGSYTADLWFQHLAIVTSDITVAYQRLQHHGATPITRDGPQRLPPAAGGVTAFKFRDPDGHPLELIQFPAGSGSAIWHQEYPDAVTIGIDHTAVSVADTGRSTAFYCGLLGLVEISRQVNSGPEQQRLDDLQDVAVDVVGLQPAAATPHLELLGYRAPRGRALAAAGLRDIAADRLVLQVQNLPALSQALTGAGASILATGPVVSVHSSHAAVVRDPDGHLLVLVE
ncbi:MAG: VOC family protein [Gammaproteobacteria bacterium]